MRFQVGHDFSAVSGGPWLQAPFGLGYVSGEKKFRFGFRWATISVRFQVGHDYMHHSVLGMFLKKKNFGAVSGGPQFQCGFRWATISVRFRLAAISVRFQVGHDYMHHSVWNMFLKKKIFGAVSGGPRFQCGFRWAMITGHFDKFLNFGAFSGEPGFQCVFRRFTI